MQEVLRASAVEQARLVRTGAVSSQELTRLYLERIDRLNSKLSAFVDVFSHRAMLDARLKDAERILGRSTLPPFHGVPIGIKDLNLVRFSTAHFGSKAFRLWSPVDDATVSQLRKGGFVVLGKLAASEMGAMPVTEPDIHPPTRNPWNLNHTSGGSSGGSSAAVAASLVPLAHGSYGAGSVRIPASFCHLYGLKPSRGRLRNHFWMDDRHLIYTCGPLTRTVEDAAAALDVMAGVTAGKPHRLPLPPRPFQYMSQVDPRPLRIHLTVRSPVCETHPEIAEATRRVAQALASAGHQVEEVDPPAGSVDEFLPLFQKMVSQAPGVNWAQTQPVTQWLALAGKKLSREEVREREAVLLERLDAAFAGADAWVTPTVAVLPPVVGAWKALPAAEQFRAAANLGAFTALFNLLGYPAATVPAGLSAEGLPIGVQIAARTGEEVRVLQLSRQVEKLLPWAHRAAQVD
jgi:amidase